MARRDQVVRRLAVDDALEVLERPTLYRATSRLLIHAPSSTFGACPCCGNPHAKIIDERPDLDLLIDTEAEWRACRSQVEDVREWDALAEEAEEVIDLPVRCAELTLPVILDADHTIILASGASRSMKTQTGSYWSLRQWMLRGGWSKIAAFVGFEMEQAHVLKDKWCVGEGEENPPVCDPRLVISYPDHLRSGDQNIHMVDGTRIRLIHTKGDGGNISGRSFIFWQWTEAAKTRDRRNYAQLRGRLVSSRGQGYIDAVPEACHWLHAAVIEAAEQVEEERQEALTKGTELPRQTYSVNGLSAGDNPWNDPEEAAQFVKDLERMDPRLAARYSKGEWVGDANKVFGEYFDPVRHTFELEAWTVDHLGMADVTRAASQRLFYEPKDWLCPLDVNANPHSVAMCKIGVPLEALGPIEAGRLTQMQRTRALTPANWHLVVFDFMQVWDADSEEAAKRLVDVHGGLFKNAGVIMDGTSCYRSHNAGGQANRRKNIIPRLAYEEAGFEVVPPEKTANGFPANPSRFDSSIVLRRLLRHDQTHFNRFRCRKLIRAVRDHDAEPDGITPVRASNTSADRHIISGTDVLRYVSWPFFRLDKAAPPGEARVRV